MKIHLIFQLEQTIFLSCREAVIPVISTILLGSFAFYLCVYMRSHTYETDYLLCYKPNIGLHQCFLSHLLLPHSGFVYCCTKKIISPLPKKTRYQNHIFTHNCNFKMSALATGKLCTLWVAHDHPKLLMPLNYAERLALDTSHFHASLCILVRIAHFTIYEIVSTAVHIVSVNLSSVIQF